MKIQRKIRHCPPSRWLAICLVLAATLSMAGFKQNNNRTGENDMLTEDLLQPAQLPEEYLITYEIESKSGRLIQITRGKDADGRIYFNSPTEELLFVPSGGGYQMYYADIDGNFIDLDQAVYTPKFVEETTQEFLQYAQKSSVRHSGTAKYTGDTQIAGRDCRVYEIRMKLSIFSQRYTFVIDNETGVCVEWKSAANIRGFDLTPGGNFTCIEFRTEDVRLPILDSTVL